MKLNDAENVDKNFQWFNEISYFKLNTAENEYVTNLVELKPII